MNEEQSGERDEVEQIEAKDASNEAAREAAAAAAEQAKAAANEAFRVVQRIDFWGKTYLASLAVVVVCCSLFSMNSFDVRSEGAVSPVMAQEQREWERRLNSSGSYSVARTFFGMPIVPLGLAGIGIFIWASLTMQRAGWIPLATVACAALVVLLLGMLFLSSFANEGLFALLPEYLEPDIDLTLLGFWVPVLAAITATVAAVKRIAGA